ncbi:uncharacterized protein LOC107040650 isoform X2 [Diachasma alloeum]|uniref:uncharacterized protein LOC107040650 isoform X2 n=1 Tax=Diachasma alloeum TaxID=454923 RepID=UPI0007384028|nr:uncharacterized protein LOC107040650 isoform X2 [Diachasma alloeum]
MSHIPSENGAKVTLIKKKFEGTMCDLAPSNPDQKDILRRSLSASPVKVKKNLKLNVTRQLSNPSKNIKRTPAFRGDKLSRVKHLHSPSIEKSPSLVHKTVKIFEETAEYGQIGSVKKKTNFYISNSNFNESNEKKSKEREISAKIMENTVRTTVISRHKNIYPLRTEEESKDTNESRDEIDFSSLVQNKKIENCENIDSSEIEKFLMNGVEYTRVVKPSKSPDNIFRSSQEAVQKNVDVREELSRRKSSKNISLSLELTESLKAALQSPLPSGPPPKKPPRTFAHSPLVQRSHPDLPVFVSPKSRSKPLKFVLQTTESDITDSVPKNSFSSTSTSDDDFSSCKDFPKFPTTSDKTREQENEQNELNKLKEPKIPMNFCSLTHQSESTHKPRNSQKMLEKLETVLIQHQKALGPKVIMPRRDRSEISIGFDSNKSQSDLNIKNSVEKNDKKSFFSNRLSRTTEGDRKLGKFDKSKSRKHSTFDCLPYLNCASCTVYEQPTFQHYFELSTFLEGRRRDSGDRRNEERVYAEPFSFDTNSGTDITGLGNLSSAKCNYLSRSWCDEGNKKQEEVVVGGETGGRIQSAEVHYLAEQLLNQAFGKFPMSSTEPSTESSTSSDTDSLASTLSLTEELTTFSDKLRLFKNHENTHKLSKEKLHRSLTEKRKYYVRKVSTKYAPNNELSLRRETDRLFDVCLLVELNLSTKVPYVKDKYPIYAEVPAWIENFCFPDAQDWPPDDSNHNQFHSLCLMDEKGNRRFGYCIRVKPEGGPVLPLTYCLITKHRASGFYHKVLQELEGRHGLSDKNRRGFIEELYNSSMPKPGNSLRMIKEEQFEALSNFVINNNKKDNEGERLKAVVKEGGRGLREGEGYESLIMRTADPRLEERDMSQLFDAVNNKVLIFLFGSLLLERKVVLLGGKLSKLSTCVEALQSLLYPFRWPHTFIPVLPDIEGLQEILGAPPPFVIGILKEKGGSNAQVGSIQDGIVVDLDTSKVLTAVGDEGSILPKRLQEGIRSALQLVTNNTEHGDVIRNFLVSEAFLRVFVETCAHLETHLATQQDGKIILQKESFVKACTSKTVQFFLEWFVETIMFNSFITDYIASVEGTTVGESYDIKLFKQRVAEFRKLNEENLLSKKTKKKTFGKFIFNF